MTKEETRQIVKVIISTYPMTYKNVSQEDTKNMIYVWYEVFKEYDITTVLMALKSAIANDTKGFPPAPGQIMAIIKSFKRVSGEEKQMNGIEAWTLVYKALRNSIYNSEEEFNKLPTLVQKTIGNPRVLKDWAVLGTDELQTVTQSNFMRTYNAVVKREEEMDCIPMDIKTAIGYKETSHMYIETKKEEEPKRAEKNGISECVMDILEKFKKDFNVTHA